MKFGLSNEYTDYFNKNHAIELEGLLSAATVDLLNDEVERLLAQRLKCPISDIKKRSPDALYKVGRDFWRNSTEIKKTLTAYQLLDIVAKLNNQKLLRIGFDQYIPESDSTGRQEQSYMQLIDRQATIEQVTCLQGIVAGMIICLQGPQDNKTLGAATDTDADTKEQETLVAKEPVEKGQRFFPLNKGNVLIFNPQAVINFKELLANRGSSYLLATYTHGHGVFVFNPQDANGHCWRDLGYNPGDRLKEKLNPIVYRE
jgi:hypothetical protein